MNIQDYLNKLGQSARIASRSMSATTRGDKDKALEAIAAKLIVAKDQLLDANQRDIQAAIENGIESALLDRLELNQARIEAMAEGCQQVAALSDPVGEISELSYRPSGIQVGRMRVPLGVIGIVYESRPNVTIDAAALCLKSGNATILRGGSEAIHSNRAIAEIIAQSLASSGLNPHSIQLVETTDREAVGQMISMPEYIDVIIPRGGKGLIERISNNAKVPVIKHLDGICHVYLDAEADLKKAFDIAINSKTHRYGVCNAMETLLVHQALASELLPSLASKYSSLDVELRGCPKTVDILVDFAVGQATEEDWQTEYLAPILSIRVVEDYQHATV